MWRAFAVLLLAGLSASAGAVELKNFRATYGGSLGPTRPDNKFLPGDLLFMTYEIHDLTLDPKTGHATFVADMELFDGQNKSVYKKDGTPVDVEPILGGNQLPSDVIIEVGRNQPAGKYSLKLTVTDRLAKKTKSFTYPFEVLPKGFGIIKVAAPAFGLPGQPYAIQFGLVDVGLDSKNMPNAEVTLNVLDATTQKPVRKPFVVSYPKDLPDDMKIEKESMVPVFFPFASLNRSGNFILDIEAKDKVGKKQAKMRLPLHVLDVGKILGK